MSAKRVEDAIREGKQVRVDTVFHVDGEPVVITYTTGGFTDPVDEFHGMFENLKMGLLALGAPSAMGLSISKRKSSNLTEVLS